MRIRIIDLSSDRQVYPMGFVGENDFRTMEIIPPHDMRNVDFYVARFGIGNENVPSETMTLVDGVLTLALWQRLTKNKSVTMTLEGYIGESLIGKSHMVTLQFREAAGGADPSEESDPTIAAQINELHEKAFTSAEETPTGIDFYNIRGEKVDDVYVEGGTGGGTPGKDGATFTPAVSAGGDLSWTNNGGKPNPPTVNVKGPQGAPGMDGAQGPKGDVGTQGDTGAQGAQGLQGEPGTPGTKGDTGATGLQGPKGDTGAQGAQGTPGADGKDGTGVNIRGSYDSIEALRAAHPTGAVGDAYLISGYLWVWSDTESDWINVGIIQGPKGDTGAQGAQGLQGEPGTPGTPGAKGDTGAQGLQGPKGDTGAQGAQGLQGEPGTPGTPGAKGDTGAQGAQGLQGEPGTPGTPGAKGDTGAQGLQGLQGEPGTPGTPGAKGDTGAQGLQGPKGDTGAQGAQGPKGDTGATGAQGLQGAAGAGLPTGGTAGQIPVKASATNFDVEWQTRIKTVTMTQAQYNALVTKDANTLYAIVG